MVDKIKEILAKQLGVEADAVEEGSNIMKDLGADSLDVVELLMAIEEAFGVSVPDDDVPGLKTVKDIADYIEKNQAK